MRIKKVLVDVLKNCPPAYVGASKIFHMMNRGFKPGNYGAPDAIYRAFERTKTGNGKASTGDYYEFGLFKGYTFWFAHDACKRLGLDDVRFYGFDSFKGMPEIVGIDKANKEFYKGQFVCSKEQVIENLTQHGVDWSRTELIEGFYEDVLNENLRRKHPFGKAAVAFLDCDLYTSTSEVLKWLRPYLVEGSIAIFDDWSTFGGNSELGQRKALADFLKANPQFDAEDLGSFPINGKTFLFHVKKEGSN